ncbi:MAG: hypothetical protein J3K34DRAFT_183438 [Monoraphidium minutum]|nr:MAG: hypothetical protein J3K34DRAFT_183438 [Monoraphidium minutum]
MTAARRRAPHPAPAFSSSHIITPSRSPESTRGDAPAPPACRVLDVIPLLGRCIPYASVHSMLAAWRYQSARPYGCPILSASIRMRSWGHTPLAASPRAKALFCRGPCPCRPPPRAGGAAGRVIARCPRMHIRPACTHGALLPWRPHARATAPRVAARFSFLGCCGGPDKNSWETTAGLRGRPACEAPGFGAGSRALRRRHIHAYGAPARRAATWIWMDGAIGSVTGDNH